MVAPSYLLLVFFPKDIKSQEEQYLGWMPKKESGFQTSFLIHRLFFAIVILPHYPEKVGFVYHQGKIWIISHR